MKVTTLLNRSAIATLLFSASLTAFAGGGGPRGPAYPSEPAVSNVALASVNAAPAVVAQGDAHSIVGANTASGKTRAQVQAELLQAEEAGFLPIHKNDFPPSAGTIARNRARFQQVGHAWQSEGQFVSSAR